MTDRCCNGGAIINTVIPETGDHAQPLVYAATRLLSVGCLLFILRRKS